MTDFEVRLLMNGADLTTVAHGDTTQTFVDLSRTWRMQADDTVKVTVYNNGADSHTFNMSAYVLLIGYAEPD